MLGLGVALLHNDAVVVEVDFWDAAFVLVGNGIPVADGGNGRDEDDLRGVFCTGAEVDTTTNAGDVGFRKALQGHVEVYRPGVVDEACHGVLKLLVFLGWEVEVVLAEICVEELGAVEVAVGRSVGEQSDLSLFAVGGSIEAVDFCDARVAEKCF